jgi:poly(A) polymerase
MTMNDRATAPACRIAPPAFLADTALRAVLAALPRARLIGGCVRDALAGLPVQDIDLATPDPPEVVAEALRRAGLRVLPTGLDHGTLTALAEGRGFEVTTLRHDVETDGRHARVAFHDDWRAPAGRGGVTHK